MTPKQIKARRATRSEAMAHDTSIALTPSNGTGSVGTEAGSTLDNRFLGRVQSLSRLANEQARLHPLTTFGIVLAAGLVAVAASRKVWPWANR